MKDKFIEAAYQRIFIFSMAEPFDGNIFIPTLFFLSKADELQIPINWDTYKSNDSSAKTELCTALTKLNKTRLFNGDFILLIKNIPKISDHYINDVFKTMSEFLSKSSLTGSSFIDLTATIVNFRHGLNIPSKFITHKVTTVAQPYFSSFTGDEGNLLSLNAGIGTLTSNLLTSNQKSTWNLSVHDSIPSVNILSKMYLFLLGISPTNILTVNYSKEKYDVIVAEVPYSRGKWEESEIDNNPASLTNASFIENVLELLKEEGLGIFIVPDRLLLSKEKTSRILRRSLILRNWVDSVISIPNKLDSSHIGINRSILVVKRYSKPYLEDKKIFFEINKIPEDKKRPIRARLDDVITRSVIVNNSSVREAKYILQPSNYLLSYPDKSDVYVNLSEVAELRVGTHLKEEDLTDNGSIPYILIRHLANEKGTFQIDQEQIDRFVQGISQIPEIRKIYKGNILLACIGTSLKPTLYSLDIPAIASSNVVILRPDITKVLPEYLIIQLKNDYVKQFVQDNSLSLTNYYRVNTDTIRRIKIKLPSLSEQLNQVNLYLGERLAKSQDEYRHALRQEVHEISKRLRHTLGNSLKVFKTDLESLIHFFQKVNYNPITKPESRLEIAEKSRVMDILKRMLTESFHAERSIQLAQDWSTVSQGMVKKTTASLYDLLQEETNKEIWTKYCNIEIIGPDVRFSFDHDLMQILIRNFLDNAIRHGGFLNSPKVNNTVQIEISTNEDILNKVVESKTVTGPNTLTMVIRNNGLPFHNGFDSSFFEENGETTNGTGFGGALIKQILKLHEGKLSILPTELTASSSFKVQFLIEFPLA